MNQESAYYGAHFVIDENETCALAPDPSYVLYHVAGKPYKLANPNYWNQDRTRYPRSDGNYYVVGIEHCHNDESGKFSSSVLQQSHQLVQWLKSTYGQGLDIGRHYDFSGKCCPMWFAPAIKGANTPTHDIYPTGNTETEERSIKEARWQLLLNYYAQSNPAATGGLV